MKSHYQVALMILIKKGKNNTKLLLLGVTNKFFGAGEISAKQPIIFQEESVPTGKPQKVEKEEAKVDGARPLSDAKTLSDARQQLDATN
ncbi:hypothetical protein V6N11_033741 [Hibiscus sabdariffa]|uniref:Uncharacterized protein n=1 Tax=Hibiscus sabdariffa TaxID=183260 RepID=A0ABR2S182_9ROSI